MKAVVIVLALLLVVSTTKAEDIKIYNTVIVGGGIAGLTAAWKLKNKDILLLEKWPKVGGRIWDDKYKGFYYARGAEYLGEPEGVLADIIQAYGLKPVEIRSPAIRHYNPHVPGYKDTKIWNGYYGIALMHVQEDGGGRAALNTYNQFQRTTTRLVNQTYDAGELPHQFDLSHKVAKYDFMTMAEWFEKNGFKLTYQDKWNSHARGLYGASMKQVSILMAISELGWEYYELDDITMPEDNWNIWEPDQYPTETYTFINGLSAISQAISADLKDKIQTSSLVTRVSRSDRTYKIEYKRLDLGTNHSVRARNIVLAVPAKVALYIAGGIIPALARQIMKNIKYCEYITVNMFSDQPIMDYDEQGPKSFELSTPDRFWVNSFYDGLYVQKTENPDNKNNDKVFITTAYATDPQCGSPITTISDEIIMKRTYRDIDEIFPGASERVLEYKINRFKEGYPLMDLGAYHRIASLNRALKRHKTLKLVGDYMALPTIEAAIEQAAFAVRKLK